MASIAQKKLFRWKEVDRLGDLDRLRLVLENLPDEELMQTLEEARGKGRNDYQIRAVWNSVISGIVFEHDSVEQLRRELSRNAQLRQLCGFHVFLGEDAVPPVHVYSRFLKSLMNHQDMVDAMFEDLVDTVRKELPGFGKSLAIDSKAIKSHAKKRRKGRTRLKRDGRRDDDHAIKPVIDIRNIWRDGEETRMIPGMDNVVHDYRGNISCYCPVEGECRPMAYGGFEKDRQSLKYRCPAQHYGLTCKGEKKCPVQGAIRISLSDDRRIFTPLARSSYKWKTAYKKRTAVERVNSRLDVSFGFEQHFIRGLIKMKLRCSLALCVMLAMALGRIRENQKEKMRSLVTATG